MLVEEADKLDARQMDFWKS